MRITAMVAFVALVPIGPASSAAQQPANGAPPSVHAFGSLFVPPSKPPSAPRFLFPTPPPALNRPQDAAGTSKPAVVCGLTLIPGDPDVDPAIGRDVPRDGPRFSIRSVVPKVCRRP